MRPVEPSEYSRVAARVLNEIKADILDDCRALTNGEKSTAGTESACIAAEMYTRQTRQEHSRESFKTHQTAQHAATLAVRAAIMTRMENNYAKQSPKAYRRAHRTAA